MKLRTDLTLRHIGKSYIIVDPSRSEVDMAKVITLNDTAVWLWKQLMEKDFSTDDIANLLVEEYEIEKDRALGDAEKFAAQFKELGFLSEQ